MITQRTVCFIILLLNLQFKVIAQKDSLEKLHSTLNCVRWVSVGGRSTLSTFSDEGSGVGTGGQFRIQLNNKVNTDWFADYIVVSSSKNLRSTFYHIGWSVLFYPFDKMKFPANKLQPFILAGHCFDYNEKTIISNPDVTKNRWGSAVQAGVGTHFNLSSRFDLTLKTQYMIHFTKELVVEQSGNVYSIEERKGSALEGHLLTTVSVNYKLFRLW